MSFQAYLDAIEDKTGLSPRELLRLASERGLDKHVGSGGTHRDESTELWLDGKNNRPS